MKNITAETEKLIKELIEKAGLKKGDILVVGCSSSEIVGSEIGHGSSLEAAEAVFEGIYPTLREKGIYLAAQCCEHLNRAIIVESEYAKAVLALKPSGYLTKEATSAQILEELQNLRYPVA